MPHSERSEPTASPPRPGPRACLVPGCTNLARRRPRHANPLEEHGCVDPMGAVPLCCVHHTMRDRFELFVSSGAQGIAFWSEAGARIAAPRAPLLALPATLASTAAGDAERAKRRRQG